MPPFVPPSEPPALIQPVAPQFVSDRPNSLSSRADTISGKDNTKPTAQLDLTTDDSQLPSIPLAVTESPPPVVEVYFSNPKEIALPLVKQPASSQDAEGLGTPISVGEGASPEATSNNPATSYSTEGASQSLILQGLNQANPSNHRSQRSAGGSSGCCVEQAQAQVLVTQVRNGEGREFDLSAPVPEQDLLSQPTETQTQQPPQTAPSQEEEPVRVIEVISDQQQYNRQQQVVTAQGNVVMRFAKAVMTAERLQVNLSSRVVVAEGNVVLKRGDQLLRGDRFEYYLVQDSGVILNASGEIYQPSLGRDLSDSDLIPDQPLTDRLAQSQPLQRVTTAGGYQFSAGSVRDINLVGQQDNSVVGTAIGGQVNRLRFEAERINFYPEGWDATNIRLTNDPFSPPEFEVRADTAKLRSVEPLVDEVTLTNSRVVFDQGFSPPIFQDRLVFDRRPRQPGVVEFGFDGDDRGGLFVQRTFPFINTERVSFQIAPQYLLQRAFFPGSFDSQNIDQDGPAPLSLDAFGLKTELGVNLGPRTNFSGTSNLTSFDFDNIDNHLRAKLQLQQSIGDLSRPYLLSLEYNFRERLFNGSLGFQTVYSSIGAIIVSPDIPIGNTGINLRYQGSIQNIDADTDRLNLLSADRDNNRTNLTRYQGAASLSRGFLLWQGQALAPTPEEGLRYTAAPVVPFVQLSVGLTGVASFYSNGDSQPSLSGSIGLSGQFGHFSRPFLDYTGLSITYTQGIRGDESPFLFDRFVDQQTISLAITQQIYGPVRFGVQTSFSLSENDEISTNYFLEYSRRTYNIILQYNPVLSIGSVNLRINDFNWVGEPEPFGGSGIRPVVQGVSQ